jgi:hypothetical protein
MRGVVVLVLGCGWPQLFLVPIRAVPELGRWACSREMSKPLRYNEASVRNSSECSDSYFQ